MRKEGNTMARKRTKEPAPPAERYPYVARWCNAHGWIEVGCQWQDEFFARAVHEGGLAWGGQGPYPTVDDALQALEEGIREFIEENGWE